MGLPLARFSPDAFLAWEDAQTERHEYHRGEVYAMVGGTARHNRVILNLSSRLLAHLAGTDCHVYSETMKVRIRDGFLYPDVMVACGRGAAGDERVIDDPRVIVEVLSPTTSGYDRRDKFVLYRSLASLSEYVLVDPARREVDRYRRADGPQGAWSLTVQAQHAALRLDSIDFSVPLDALFDGVAGEPDVGG